MKHYAGIGASLEAGTLSEWLHWGVSAAGLAVELLETRHVRRAFEIMSVRPALRTRAALLS